MNRLQRELQRLYLLPAPEGADNAAPALVDAQGRVRALVLEVGSPADWAPVSAVWQGVQADLALPAPAIAVSGRDGYQLWFSLSEPVPATEATALLDALCLRYLGDIAPHRVRTVAGPGPQAELIPAPQADPTHWSAFVAPDLAPMFSEEPWLDTPPNIDGQASLLTRLASIRPDELAQAFARLSPGPAAEASSEAVTTPAAATVAGSTGPSTTMTAPAGGWQDPRLFLMAVMNDERLPWAQRIDAAKALLSASPAAPGP